MVHTHFICRYLLCRLVILVPAWVNTHRHTHTGEQFVGELRSFQHGHTVECLAFSNDKVDTCIIEHVSSAILVFSCEALPSSLANLSSFPLSFLFLIASHPISFCAPSPTHTLPIVPQCCRQERGEGREAEARRGGRQGFCREERTFHCCGVHSSLLFLSSCRFLLSSSCLSLSSCCLCS